MTNRGFTLLYAVLFISVSLAISLGVSSLIIGQVRISGSVRESQTAFYASDSGAECAFYWDLNGEFSTSSPPASVSCGGDSNTVVFDDGSGSFSFGINLENNSCANVTVNKSDVNETVITSLGRSPCEGRRVERGLRVRY